MDAPGWSEETYTIPELIERLGLPNLVLVTEGFLNEDDDGDFSFGNGDTIQMNYVKTTRHFVAKPLDHNVTGMYPVNDTLIPVGNTGPVQIVGDAGKVYNSVQSLIDESPRFVKTESVVACKDSNNLEFVIPAGVTLDLEHNVSGNTVMCHYKGNQLTIDVHQTAFFSLLSDNTVYSLDDMISRLPVTVKFIDLEDEVTCREFNDSIENSTTFYGVYRLLDVTDEECVIGYCNYSNSLPPNSSTPNKSPVLCLPLRNPAVQQLEVHVALNNTKNIPNIPPSDSEIIYKCQEGQDTPTKDIHVANTKQGKRIPANDVIDTDAIKPQIPPRTYRRHISTSQGKKSREDSLEKDTENNKNRKDTVPDTLPDLTNVDDGYCMLKDVLHGETKESTSTLDDANDNDDTRADRRTNTESENDPVSALSDKDAYGYTRVKFKSRKSDQEQTPPKVLVQDDMTVGGYSTVKFDSEQESTLPKISIQEDSTVGGYSMVNFESPLPRKEPTTPKVSIQYETVGGYSIVNFEEQSPTKVRIQDDATVGGYSIVKFETNNSEQETTSPKISIQDDSTVGGYSIVNFDSSVTDQDAPLTNTNKEETKLVKYLSDPSLNVENPKQRKNDTSRRKTFKRSVKRKMEKLSSKFSKIHIKREDSAEETREDNDNSDQLQSPVLKDDFHVMSVSEVAQCFRLFELENMANICEKEDLDGQFFVGLTIGYLTRAFNLSNVDALKVYKLSQGWRPDFDTEGDQTMYTSF